MDALKLSLLVTPGRFAQQMQYLKDHGFTTITLDDWMAARSGKENLPRNPVILTFEDGRLTVYENALPVLKRHKQKAILSFISHEVRRVVKDHVDWSMVREMPSTGLITFGSQTVRHVSLSPLTPARALMELSYSKMAIERSTGAPLRLLLLSIRQVQCVGPMLVGAAEHRAATTEIPGWSRVTDNAYELRGVHIDWRDNMAVSRAKVGRRG